MALDVKADGFVETANLLVGEFNRGIYLVSMHQGWSGTPGSVEMDWRAVIECADTMQLKGFHHTHPQGFGEMSQRDHDTMDAWCHFLGIPLICAITEGGNTRAWIKYAPWLNIELEVRGFSYRVFNPATYSGDGEMLVMFKPRDSRVIL